MKHFIVISFLFFSLTVCAQSGKQYVAARGGMSLRDKPSIDAAVLEKIPYGAAVVPLDNNGEWIPGEAENMSGYWRKVVYNKKTGFVLDVYLFSVPPPKSTIKDLKTFLQQTSTAFGNKLTLRSGKMSDIEEGGWELQKQLYKNGMEVHTYLAYEYNSDTYFLTNFDLNKAFVLLRMIPEFALIFPENDPFPVENKKYRSNQSEYSLTVEKEGMETATPWVKKIKVEFEQGAYYTFEMYMLDNQAVIFFGGGV